MSNRKQKKQRTKKTAESKKKQLQHLQANKAIYKSTRRDLKKKKDKTSLIVQEEVINT